MRLLPRAAILGVLLAPALAHADATPLTTVPITLERSHVHVPVSIQGSAPFRLTLDTGMPTGGVILYARPRVDSLGLAFTEGRALRGAGGTGEGQSARVATARNIRIGEVTIENVQVVVTPLPAGFPKDADGIVGMELFEHYGIRVDADRLHLDLFDPSALTPPESAAVVPLVFRGRSAFVQTKIRVSTGALEPALLAIDTGASHALWLNARDGRLDPPPVTITTILGRGLSGDIRGQIGRVRRFEMGPIAFDNVVATFPVEEHQNPGHGHALDGFVGGQILTRFRITYDYPGKRMFLESGPRTQEPFEHEMSGMMLDGPDRNWRRVNRILPGSPAEQAGIAVGDTLVAVDGAPLGALGADGLSKALKRDGAEVAMTFQRAGARIEKKVRLRRLL